MSDQPYKKKLIEVALPLDAINREAAREKSIRHGHPSTLHLWWARRPLAACRAVLFAQLVDDPSAHPEEFPTDEAQDLERQRLFEIIERLVKWDNSTNETVLAEARNEILRSCDGALPFILDPFAGGGSIPLEAQRLGLEAHASDLNPVAVLINKALIEIPPRWTGRPPVRPHDDQRLRTESWSGTQGLAEDVRWYGEWMRGIAVERIGHLYPMATLPDGSAATVVAWIWVRTVKCPNPACGATMPLASSYWLGKRKGKESWIKPVVDDAAVSFSIGHGAGGPPDTPKIGRGSKFRCTVCSEVAPEKYMKSEGMSGRIGQQLMAIVAEGDRQRTYLAPTSEDESLALGLVKPEDLPDQEVPEDPRNVWCKIYGFERWEQLFTTRQLIALTTFSDLIVDVRSRVHVDAVAADMEDSDARAYADAVATYLAFAISKLADRHSTLTNWYVSRESTSSTFQRQAIPMLWDFVETNPLLDGTGTFMNAATWTAEVLDHLSGTVPAVVRQSDAASTEMPNGIVVSTDPPYYDNIGYADLSDYFYVWLRRSLRDVYPALFGTLVTPKVDELIASPYRFGGSREKAKAFFEAGFIATFDRARSAHDPTIPMTVFYAFKQSEDTAGDGTASTGWETLLEGMVTAGFAVTATWPVRTEASNRMLSVGTNALASSIVLACRPRSDGAGVTDRRSLLSELRAELPNALRSLQQGSIAPVDLAQAAIGPGMGVFTRYAKVVEPSGEPMRVRTALGLINQVLDEVLAEQEGDFDPDTRWAVKWFEQHGFDHGSFDTAETLFKATGTALNGLKTAGIVSSEKGKVWLVPRDEMPDDWDPLTDERTPVWEATQHLVKRLDESGEQSAADLLRVLGGVGDTARELAYRLYAITEKKGWAKEGGAYNALVVAWPDIQRAAAAEKGETYEAGQLL